MPARWVEGKMCYSCHGPIEQKKTGRKRRYCSTTCRQRWWRRINKPKRGYKGYSLIEAEQRIKEFEKEFGELDFRIKHRIKKQMPWFQCKHCGRPFIMDTRQRKDYCSRQCKDRHRGQAQKMKAAVERAWKR